MAHALDNNVNYFLSLQASGQNFVIASDLVQEVIMGDVPVKVPNALPIVAGLLSVRGKVLTAIDIGMLLGGSSVLDKNHTHFAVVIEHSGELYGLLVNSVGEVLLVNQENIESLPNNLTDSIKAISDGVYKGSQNLYTIISIDKLLNYFA